MGVNIKQVKNNNFIPHLENEGTFYKNINVVIDKKYMKSHERLSNHHTLSSIRRCNFYDAERVPRDKLDFVLSALYDHSDQHFPETNEYYVQKETMGMITWRRLKNTFDQKIPETIPLGHPLRFGGIIERRSPHNIKLMNSSHHSAKTAPGYARQPLGGNIFYY